MERQRDRKWWQQLQSPLPGIRRIILYSVNGIVSEYWTSTTVHARTSPRWATRRHPVLLRYDGVAMCAWECSLLTNLWGALGEGI